MFYGRSHRPDIEHLHGQAPELEEVRRPRAVCVGPAGAGCTQSCLPFGLAKPGYRCWGWCSGWRSIRIVVGSLAAARKASPSRRPMIPLAVSSRARRASPSSSIRVAVPVRHRRPTLTQAMRAGSQVGDVGASAPVRGDQPEDIAVEAVADRGKPAPAGGSSSAKARGATPRRSRARRDGLARCRSAHPARPRLAVIAPPPRRRHPRRTRLASPQGRG